MHIEIPGYYSSNFCIFQKVLNESIIHQQKISSNEIQALINPLLVDQSKPNKISEDLKITV